MKVVTRKKKNRVEVWAGRGRHLCTVQAVALTVVPDTALHPPRKRGSNFWTLALSSIVPPANPWKFYMTETVFFLFFFFFEVLPFVFMGLGGHLCGPINSGEFRAHQDMCQWPRPAGKAGGVLEEGQRLPLLINTISFLSLPITFCQDISGFWHLILRCLKAVFPRCWYKVTLN